MIEVIDAVESWLVTQPLWFQAPILLAVLLPICWLLAGVVDKVVGFLLRKHHSAELATATAVAAPSAVTAGQAAESTDVCDAAVLEASVAPAVNPGN